MVLYIQMFDHISKKMHIYRHIYGGKRLFLISLKLYRVAQNDTFFVENLNFVKY